ncbi:di-trans,poly-cis-decaprenylcistransferase [Candidatus Saccharibacteria bacterium]|nr:di-trans,poly-cis-decaprenylcistransferase [Candidatus Saccharibacteria bacterium]
MQHLGFIVDGNRRWAREKNLPTLEGHRKGLEKVEDIIDETAKHHIPFVSFYLFSTENWDRSKEEVSYLMKLLGDNIGRLAKKMKKNDLKCIILGSKNRIAPKLLKKLRDAEELTKECLSGTVCFCFNYGGKQEIVDAANAAAKKGEITIDSLEKHLYHPEVPPCDMIVRTSGEERISGFMLWRAAYSEFLFLKKYWPDIEPNDVEKILKNYQKRNRRFGK